MVSYFSGKSLKLLPPDALILAQNTPKCVWRPGSARTRWGSLSTLPYPLAAKRGPTSKGRGGREEGDAREGEGREGRDFAGPIKIWLLRPWCRISINFIIMSFRSHSTVEIGLLC